MGWRKVARASVTLSVRCRCWDDGLCEPLPAGAGPVWLDEDGWLQPSNPHGTSPVGGWKASACRHPFMEAADADKGWAGIYEEVEHVGPERVPVLTDPVGHHTNGGHVSWQDCALALEEPDVLRAEPLLAA